MISSPVFPRDIFVILIVGLGRETARTNKTLNINLPVRFRVNKHKMWTLKELDYVLSSKKRYTKIVIELW